jgi:YtkA-like
VRVRPLFWCLLVFTCISALVFAATFKTHAPAILHVHLEQQPPVSDAFTTLYLRLTDQEGLPIEQAQVLVSANMTNMEMVTREVRVRNLGRGNYLAQLLLYMAGPWEIHIVAYANDFASSQQALFILVQ